MLIHILIIKNFYQHICSFGFVSPLIKYRNLLKDKDYKIKIFHEVTEEFFDCDFVFVEKRFLSSLIYSEKKKFFKKLNCLNKNQKKIFVDTSDSTGQIEKDFLILFDSYWKGQMLKNLNLYNFQHYGGRYFCDFNKKNFKIKDTNEIYSDKITEKNLLKKIEISWNLGLVNFDFYAPIHHKLYSFLKFNFFFKNPSVKNKNILKSKDITCRLGFNHQRKTVKLQRLKIKSLLKNIANTNKINRKKYFKELSESKLSISPFGWGEICNRDFETFICGSCLIKPDMSLIKTWPDYFIKDLSYFSFNWNLKNFIDRLNFILDRKDLIEKISYYGQNLYIKYNLSKDSAEIFSNRFIKLLKKKF